MEQILDIEHQGWSRKWKHRHPVYTGWIVGAGLIALNILLAVLIGWFNRAMYTGEGDVTTSSMAYRFVPILFALFFLLILLLPSISAMYLFRQANEVATYKNQFRTAFRANYVPNLVCLLLISLANNTIDYSESAAMVGGFLGIFIMAAILAAITSSILAIFFRKRAVVVY